MAQESDFWMVFVNTVMTFVSFILRSVSQQLPARTNENSSKIAGILAEN